MEIQGRWAAVVAVGVAVVALAGCAGEDLVSTEVGTVPGTSSTIEVGPAPPSDPAAVEACRVAVELSMAHDPTLVVEGAYVGTPGQVATWQEDVENGAGAGPTRSPLRDLDDATPVTVCFYSGDFGGAPDPDMPPYDRRISTIVDGEARGYVVGPRQYHPPVDVGQIEVSPDPMPNAAELEAMQEGLMRPVEPVPPPG